MLRPYKYIRIRQVKYSTFIHVYHLIEFPEEIISYYFQRP